MGTDSAGGRTGDAAQEFQEGRFAGTVLADDTYDVALLDLEVDIAERPDVLGVILRYGSSLPRTLVIQKRRISWLRVLVETKPRRYCLDTWLNSIAVLITVYFSVFIFM